MDILGALREGLAPHYTVEREIGAGGMATVFLAAERHPTRKVAIKVMNPEVATPSFRERFIREVEITSKLSHPHIVPILAADECLFVADGPDGLCYYVMPYIEGESLRQRLQRERRVAWDDALRITLEVADALSYAHAQGVIHRDIKPENILLSHEHASLADFGIARAISAAGGETLTGVGQAVGSPAYMSPEQLAGSRAIDGRSDIYSLACVLYEMLVGEPPLLGLVGGSTGDSRTLASVLRQQDVSRAEAFVVKDAIGRALATLPQDRFANVEAFADRLRMAAGERRSSHLWRLSLPGRKTTLLAGAAALIGVAGLWFLSTRGRALDPARVVVAAFENRSGEAPLASLGHVAADWLTQGIAQQGLVQVAPVTRTPRPVDAATIRSLAFESRARTVVTGSYYLDGDTVRFQLQIIDAASGTVRRALEVGTTRTGPDAAGAVRRRVLAVIDTLFARPPRQ